MLVFDTRTKVIHAVDNIVAVAINIKEVNKLSDQNYHKWRNKSNT